jgi:transposase
VTSKFADYLPLYRLEDIFERQGFEISRATHLHSFDAGSSLTYGNE